MPVGVLTHPWPGTGPPSRACKHDGRRPFRYSARISACSGSHRLRSSNPSWTCNAVERAVGVSGKEREGPLREHGLVLRTKPTSLRGAIPGGECSGPHTPQHRCRRCLPSCRLRPNLLRLHSIAPPRLIADCRRESADSVRFRLFHFTPLRGCQRPSPHCPLDRPLHCVPFHALKPAETARER